MASDTIHKQQFSIRDLSTRSVTLFPTQAQIIRDIKGIQLQPGQNQIVIDGLAPTCDEPSIKVEGTGSATITAVSVDFLPNREVYEDIYPSDDEDEEESSDEESEAEIEEMKSFEKKIKKLQVSLLDEQEKINSGSVRLQICDNFGKSVEKSRPPPADLKDLIAAYKVEREKIFRDHEASTAAAEVIQEQITQAEKEMAKFARGLVKANEKKEKEKAKVRAKKLRKRAEIAKEKARIKLERESFWPRKVYRVTISMETSALDTPASSRRNSIDGDTIVNLATSDFHEPSKATLKSGEISLSLSYITYSAYWAPRYDLALNTLKCSGALDYGAELKNATSETWKDAKIILSTSQTNFSGLSESIPHMHAWHVKLLKGNQGKAPDSALFSQREIQAKQNEWNSKVGYNAQKPRGEIFGRDSTPGFQAMKRTQKVQMNQAINPFGSHQPAPNVQYSQAFGASTSGGFGAARGLFGSAAPQTELERQPVARSMMSKLQSRKIAREEYEHGEEDEEEDMGMGLFDEGGPQPLLFEEGAWEESGMTTAYDVPGVRTLAPSNSTIKHKIAKVDFRNVVFSHIVIGKLRQVAFLKARLRNSSKISLLKGPLGLTLDGSFLGQATLPRVSSGESFSLPLGVDPTITISYPKPTVQRSQTGIFSKEDSNVFTRTVVISNTKRNGPVDLTVLDQVPVSEDERLRIEITNPRGLKIGGEGIRTGQNTFTASPAIAGSTGNVRTSAHGVDGSSSNGGKWGTAIATTKKGGEVLWVVKLNAGQGVKLVLEYEATFPGGEQVVGV